MSMLLLALAAAAQTPGPAIVPPLPDRRGLYNILFADIHTTIAGAHLARHGRRRPALQHALRPRSGCRRALAGSAHQ